MDNPEKLAISGTQTRRQSKTKTIQRNWQHPVHKHEDKAKQKQSRETGNIRYTNTKTKQNKNNPEKLATWGTQTRRQSKTKTIQRNWQHPVHKHEDKAKQKQSRETGNIRYTNTKTKQNKNTPQYVLDTTMYKQTQIT